MKNVSSCLIPCLVLLSSVVLAQTVHSKQDPLSYTVPFFPDGAYDQQVPAPEAVIGFPAGQKAALHGEIERCLLTWEGNARMKLIRYAQSHEGRTLYAAVISSPANMERLDALKNEWSRLADPTELSDAAAKTLIGQIPAPAWLAYSIHGDETSGSDAALALIHHFLAATDERTKTMLDALVIVIDPMMNPDGRDRALTQIAQHRGAFPNTDDQSLLHDGYWPGGRTNHYMFDLNRDWLYATQPETQGRIKLASSFHPLLFVDAHEMGPLDTYLFAPPRDPVNPHVPGNIIKWWPLFAKEQAGAFDQHGWRYYTGEWAEYWYPGYSDSWGAFRGGIGILYEQAGVRDGGVLRPEGTVLTYREAVHHQIVSSMANLQTFQANKTQLFQDYLAQRRQAVSSDGPFAERTFVILPNVNHGRMKRFLELMALQQIEVYQVDQAFEASAGRDRLGQSFQKRTIPKGALLVPNRQPLAHMVAAMFELDTRLSDSFLQRERREILKKGESLLYDVTAWNITMMFDLPAYSLDMPLPANAKRLTDSTKQTAPAQTPAPDQAVAFIFDGADDNTLTAAVTLMENHCQVRAVDKDIELDGRRFARGSLVVTRADNPNQAGLADLIKRIAEATSTQAVPVLSGHGPGDLPDMGGEHFQLLQRPSVAILAREPLSAYDFGHTWFVLEKQFGLKTSHLNAEDWRRMDLRRYNVLILPSGWRDAFSESDISRLKSWVAAGGTLIAIGSTAESLARKDGGLGSVRLLPEVLDALPDYELAVLREWEAAKGNIRANDVWNRHAPDDLEYPWPKKDKDAPKVDELERRDRWLRVFMPQGAIVAGRVDTQEWLTVGCHDYLPLVVGQAPILMTGEGVHAPIRLGVLLPETSEKEKMHNKDQDTQKKARLGWAVLPDGHKLQMRLSGLLWPEAAHRLANGAWLTRERLGQGQIILFASSPAFRGGSLGSARLLGNAVILGPGMGTAPRINH